MVWNSSTREIPSSCMLSMDRISGLALGHAHVNFLFFFLIKIVQGTVRCAVTIPKLDEEVAVLIFLPLPLADSYSLSNASTTV